MAKQGYVQNNVNVDLNSVPTEKCVCGNNTYTVVYLIKKISALVSPTGKATIVPVQVFACSACNTISPIFKNLNDTEEIPSSTGETLNDAVKDIPPDEPKEIKNELFLR